LVFGFEKRFRFNEFLMIIGNKIDRYEDLKNETGLLKDWN
jgi:hypothetical protein